MSHTRPSPHVAVRYKLALFRRRKNTRLRYSTLMTGASQILTNENPWQTRLRARCQGIPVFEQSLHRSQIPSYRRGQHLFNVVQSRYTEELETNQVSRQILPGYS